MILLDENIPEAQRQVLRFRRIRARQVGFDVAHKGLKDDAIIPLLHDLRRTTFFTRDLGFFRRDLTHRSYCLVCLEISQHEVASFVRRFLSHSRFNTERKRLGSVVRVTHGRIIRLSTTEPDELMAW